jgi:hypothetical protein
VEPQFTGLRCQDINLGLRSGTADSWVLSTIDNTQLVGMAADLAGLIRGRNVIDNIDALKIVASEVLDISAQVLPSVMDVLEKCGFVDLSRSAGRVTQIFETVPVFRSLYPELGRAWQQRQPRQLEEELVAAVHYLASAPVPIDEFSSTIGIDASDTDDLYALGRKAALFRSIETVDGAIVYSPYSAFENPVAMRTVLTNHGPDQLAESLQKVTNYQGLPVDAATDPVLADAVALGLLAAPAVTLPGGDLRSFASLPYIVDRELLTVRKLVLDKALAILACLRCGQHFGGATNAANAVAVLDALANREALTPHSSHERQYKLLRDQGVIRFIPDSKPGGHWKRPALIKTEENLEAIAIARSLVLNDDITVGREVQSDVRGLLDLDATALRPLQSANRSPRTNAIDAAKLDVAFEELMGRGAS